MKGGRKKRERKKGPFLYSYSGGRKRKKRSRGPVPLGTASTRKKKKKGTSSPIPGGGKGRRLPYWEIKEEK